jgi:hypothetical protein
MQAGAYATQASGSTKAGGLGDLLAKMKENYLDQDIEPVEGMNFNQYDLFRRVNLYINSVFENGNVDERGNDKFFHNIINHRCAHATKNIDLDTKDIYVTADDERGYAASFIMRAKLRCWMRDTGFADKLNRLGDKLPKYGAVIWKRVKRSGNEKKYPGMIDVEDVDLLDVIFDPSVKRIKDSPLFAHRYLLRPQFIRDMVEDGGWDEAAVDAILQAQSGSLKKSQFLRDNALADAGAFSLTDTIPTIELYEMYGWVPETAIPKDWKSEAGIKGEAEVDEYVYIMAVLDSADGSGGNIAYLKEMDPYDFPYKDCLMPARTSKRWLPFSIPELLLDLQVRANELVNRFFRALRSGSLHVFQTRNALSHANVFNDAEDGDIIVSKGEITPVSLELRAFQQYQVEYQNIETQADKIANTFEVITGENLPTNTPFRLGAQLSANASKIYEQMREECGNFLSEVFNEWIMPDIIENLTADEILDVFGSAEELKFFDESYRRAKMLESVKSYILKVGHLPTVTEFATVEKTLAEEQDRADRKLKITKEFMEEAFEYSIRFDVTGETTNKKADDETLGNLFQIVASNPAIMQDPNARMIMARIMESSGLSPLKFAGFTSSPTPAMPQAGAQPPAQKEFGGDKSTTDLTPDAAVKQTEAAGGV